MSYAMGGVEVMDSRANRSKSQARRATTTIGSKFDMKKLAFQARAGEPHSEKNAVFLTLPRSWNGSRHSLFDRDSNSGT